MLLEIAIVTALILLNGVLAMSELAIVSARPGRLKSVASNHRGALVALKLAEDPGRFLSTVQIGITLVGVLSGAFSGATLGARLANRLAAGGIDADFANTLGVGGVVIVLTYLSLVAGELVPKQIALKNAEGIAIAMAPAMALLARVASPLVWLLDRSGRGLLWVLGQSGVSKSRVTDEEVQTLLTEAHQEGLIEPEEREMMAGVMRLADRRARALMTPRRDIQMLDVTATPAETLAAIRRIARSRMPVEDRTTGEVLGIVTLQEAFLAVSRREPLVVRALLRDVPVVSDAVDALSAMEVVHAAEHHLALVYDEYGNFEGIITSGDIIEAITGNLTDRLSDEPALFEREDGSYLVAGWMPADEFCDRLGLPRGLAGDYETVAGLVINLLRHLPKLGDTVEAEGWQFEVIDLDDRRIDKVMVKRAAR